MWVTKIFPKKSKSKALIIPLVLLGLVIFMGVIFFRFFLNNNQNQVATPAKDLTISEPFSGQLYFNDRLGGNLFSAAIIAAIDEAKSNIEVAVYSLDSLPIRDALYNAAKRGVNVSLIFSDKRQAGIESIFQGKPSNVAVSYIPSTPGSMHHKFMIIDRTKLFFGSYNFTNLQEKYDPSFLMKTTRLEIVEVFGEEFNRLAKNLHGTNKLGGDYNPFAARIKYPEGYLEIWFTPQSQTSNLRQRMIDLVRGAKNNIKILIWNFTDKTLANELALAAKDKAVQIVTDDTNYSLPDSAFPLLNSEKTKHHLDRLEIITDAKRNQEIQNTWHINDLNSFLHHHLLLVDDQTAVFGTNNWSGGGFYENDESIMISNIPSLVDGFKTSFDYNYQVNK